MTRKQDKTSPIAQALRRAGYAPIPRWWVKSAELDEIRRVAMNNADEVNRIRGEVRRFMGDE